MSNHGRHPAHSRCLLRSHKLILQSLSFRDICDDFKNFFDVPVTSYRDGCMFETGLTTRTMHNMILNASRYKRPSGWTYLTRYSKTRTKVARFPSNITDDILGDGAIRSAYRLHTKISIQQDQSTWNVVKDNLQLTFFLFKLLRSMPDHRFELATHGKLKLLFESPFPCKESISTARNKKDYPNVSDNY